MRKGFYVAVEESEAIGISLAFVYNAEMKDFQIAILFGCYMFAVGYTF